MTVSGSLYAKGMLALGNKEIDWNDGNVKIALCTSSYTPDQAAHDYFNDITNEVSESGTNYTAGGATLGSPTMTSALKVATFDGADTSWASSTITARYAIVYYSTGVAATSPLIGYIDFGANISSTNGTFLITWAGTGIFTLTVA